MYKKIYPDEPAQKPIENSHKARTGPSCKYAEFVVCPQTGRKCDACGWNPEVAHARLQAYCEAHDSPMPVR